jgi:hypothetical protein
MSGARSVGKRLVLTAVVATLVVGLTGVLSVLGPVGGTSIAAGPDHDQWSPDTIVEDRIESGGTASTTGDVGVVLFDRTHANRFDQEDIAPLTRAIDQAGGEVRQTPITSGFQNSLQKTDVLVVVDPGVSYGPDDVDAIEQFVAQGGRVLMLGEPNRRSIAVSGFSVQLVTDRSRLTTLGSAFGISYGSQYLYDMENNDGNFKDVVTGPPSGTSADAVSGVDTVTMYTSVSVTTNRGTVLLRTAPTAERGNDDPDRGFPVAVTAADGDVIAVGDKTFLADEYRTVADNEVFVARLVEFMAGADHQPLDEGGDEGGNETGNETAPAIGRTTD